MTHDFHFELGLQRCLDALYDDARTLSTNNHHNIAPSLSALRAVLMPLDDSTRDRIASDYKNVLYGVVKLVKPMWNKMPANTRSLYDRVMFNTLKLERAMENDATRFFEQLVQGITYFTNQPRMPDENPSYHRSASCGPKSLTDEEYENTRSCNPTQTSDVRDSNGTRIHMCFLERLIYDKVFELFHPRNNTILSQEYQGSQDAGHVARMRSTKQHFETCFPNTKLTVDDIVCNERQIPFMVTVRRQNMLTGVEVVDTYVKSLGTQAGSPYDPRVMCQRIEVRRHGDGGPLTVTKFHKTQMFNSGEMPWQLSTPRSEQDYDAAVHGWIVSYDDAVGYAPITGGGVYRIIGTKLRYRLPGRRKG